MSEQNCIYTEQMPGRTLVADGTEYLFFSGTSYMGMSCNKLFRQHLLDGFHYYGTNYSSSRNSNLQLRVYDEAEAYLAAFTGAEAALTMSSGYLACQTLVQTLQDTGRFLYAPDTHPALWRNLKDAPTTTGLAFDVWVEQLINEIPALPEQQIVILCNSLDPLKAKDHAFSWINALPDNKQITIIVDDSHGLGVTGAEGAGIFSQLSFTKDMPQIRLLVVASLGKALGIPAGVVLGDNKTVEQLKRSTYFGGASPAIPAYLYAFLNSTSLLSEAREKLFSNISYFLAKLYNPELFSFFSQYPVFSTQHKELCPLLLKHKIMISSFRYPTPADEPITRVILNSLHTSGDLDHITDVINKFSRDLK